MIPARLPLAYVRQVSAPEKLCSVLHSLHGIGGRQDAQTVRGGTMISLSGVCYKSISRLLASFTPWIDEYTGCEPWKYEGLWSVALHKGGYHVRHDHPKGWISGVYYVQAGIGGGMLDIGGQRIQPKPGMLVLFPSDIAHGTTQYLSEEPRLTVAFDVVRA